MDIALNTADNYWSLLKGLSKDVKIELIAKLSNSLVQKAEKHVSASQFYGVWNDSDFDMTSDQLADEIKHSRTFKNDIIPF